MYDNCGNNYDSLCGTKTNYLVDVCVNKYILYNRPNGILCKKMSSQIETHQIGQLKGEGKKPKRESKKSYNLLI